MTTLATRLAGIELPSPVLVASGCAGTGRELHRFVDLAGISLVLTPSLRGEQAIGRLLPDLAGTPSGLLLAGDRSHPGVRAFCADELPWLASVGARVGVSVSGTTTGEFADVVDIVWSHAASRAVRLVELELAAPSRAAGGRPFAADPADCARVVQLVREVLPPGIALLAKLSADTVDVVSTAASVMASGADGVTLLAPPAATGVDLTTLRLAPGDRPDGAGLLGPAVRPLVAAAVARVRRAMGEGRVRPGTVVAVGGVDSGAAALDLLAVGADAVQVGSVLLRDPFAAGRTERELAALLAEHGIGSAAEAVGRALPVARPRLPHAPAHPDPHDPATDPTYQHDQTDPTDLEELR